MDTATTSMTVSIMQPYFVPYLGYFSLIKHTDSFIALDTVQYIRHGWVNRNRILKQGGGVSYIGVPLGKHGRDAKISEVRIQPAEKWRERVLGQLQHYRRGSPGFRDALEFFSDPGLDSYTQLSTLNVTLLRRVCGYLGISTPIQVFSEMNLAIDEPQGAGDWALNISRAIGASTYVNPPGGRALFDPDAYRAAGVQLQFLENRLTPYAQLGGAFEAGLSIIDVIMCNGRERTLELLDDITLNASSS